MRKSDRIASSWFRDEERLFARRFTIHVQLASLTRQFAELGSTHIDVGWLIRSFYIPFTTRNLVAHRSAHRNWHRADGGKQPKASEQKTHRFVLCYSIKVSSNGHLVRFSTPLSV
ncbi:hypothetical protein, partial [Mesorhizobium sp.]|uniref:hypothetical protein n=1 Tax=Mesorhizobium sp. TaxID=1871066 RepID=UPI0025BFC708